MLSEHTVRECLDLLRGPLYGYAAAQLAAARSRSTGEGYERALRLINQSFVSLRGERPDTLAICRVILERWDLVFARRWSDRENHLIRRLKHARNRYAHEESFTRQEIEEFVNQCVALAKAVNDEQCAAACTALLSEKPQIQPSAHQSSPPMLGEGAKAISSTSETGASGVRARTEVHIPSVSPESRKTTPSETVQSTETFPPRDAVARPGDVHVAGGLPARPITSTPPANAPVRPLISAIQKEALFDRERIQETAAAIKRSYEERAGAQIPRSAALYAEGEDLGDFFETLGWRTADKRSKGGCL